MGPWLQAGQVDVAYTTPELADQDIPNMELVALESIDNRGIVLPYVSKQGKNQLGFEVGNNVTSDIASRRALSYGIDREVLVEEVLNGYGSSPTGEELGIKINIEGTSWDIIAQDMYKDAVLMGWGAQNPLETYLLYHRDNMGRDYYNPENFSHERVDYYIDQAMSARDLEESYQYWKKVQWDGETGVATQGECPWVWLVNVDHLYFVREGLDIGKQKIHPHGHAWPLVANLKDWKWNP